MQRITETDSALLLRGETPEDEELLDRLTVGLDSLVGFLSEHYLVGYLPDGGSKIKFVTGRPGSGKTHFSRCVLREAKELGYLTVSFSAKDVWLHDFREIYLEIQRQCSIEAVLDACAKQIVREMGYDPKTLGEGKRFIDYLSERGESDALSKGEIRSALRKYFTRNPLLDNGFAACCSLLTGDILGYPVLEPANRELILAYLDGDKTVKNAQMRSLGIHVSGVTRYNARNLLRSLCEVIHLGGHPGLLVTIDDMEMLMNRGRDEPMNYTRLRREDAYESIRQLIDDIDSMRYVMFLFCADRELMDNENYGMRSYQALWLRIQNEVVCTRFNRFADILDLDRYADEAYDTDTLLRMAQRLEETARSCGISAASVSAEDVAILRRRAQYGGLGLPWLVNRAVLEGGGENV